MARRAKTAAVTTPAAADPEQLRIAIPDGAHHLAVRYILRDHIHPDPEQPRQQADAELRASIATHGLLQPITVRPHPAIIGEWMLVDGERRWRSAEGVLEELPVIVREDQEIGAGRLITQLVANTGKPLTPLEEARAYARILKATGMSQTELADLLGVARTSLNERLALLQLGPWLPLLEAGTIGLSHAVRALLPLRTIPEKYHQQAIVKLEKDYRWQKRGAGGGISVADFEHVVEQAYRAFLYPLTKTSISYHRQPAFDTKAHDRECPCGGIKASVDHAGSLRKCCGNPDWWRPRHKKAQAAKKAAEPATTTPAAKRLYLPEGTKVLTVSYSGMPKGVVELTDQEGRWKTAALYGGGVDERFDPADLVIDEAQLVELRHQYSSGYSCVGTRDVAAVKAARAAWRTRFDERAAAIEHELARALDKHRGDYQVDGAGVRKLLETVAHHHGQDLVDLADAIGIEVAEYVTKAASYERNGKAAKWLKDLDADDIAALATAFATAAGRNLKLTTERVEEEERAALAAIQKRTIPWLAKPKASSAPTKTTPAAPAKTAKTVKKVKTERRAAAPRFMQPMQPDAALAAVVGARAVPRTEITKKLWDYIKKHRLQGEGGERRMISADDTLRPVFGGKARVSMFELTKLVNAHLSPVASEKPAKPAKPARAKKAKQLDLEEAIEENADAFEDLEGEETPWLDTTDDDLWDSEDAEELEDEEVVS